MVPLEALDLMAKLDLLYAEYNLLIYYIQWIL